MFHRGGNGFDSDESARGETLYVPVVYVDGRREVVDD